MKRITKGDWDGFFALGLDNLIMLLLMGSICLGPLGFSAEFFYTRILPAIAVGLLPALGAFAYLIMFKSWSALGFGGGGDPLPADVSESITGQEIFAAILTLAPWITRKEPSRPI